MKAIAIIPARYASTRFPGKPLVDIDGKTMIRRVYEQALKAKSLAEVWVATDDQRIFDEVKAFGGRVVMTSDQHKTGTDRVAEVLLKQKMDCEILLNIQGDEPFIQPAQIDLLVDFAKQNQDRFTVCTLAKKLAKAKKLLKSSTVKVVFDKNGQALYFSRHPIPFQRNEAQAAWILKHSYYKHIGLYAFRADLLPTLAALPLSPLEQAESLEQLRWMENGYKIGVVETSMEAQSIDTPEDLLLL